MANANLLKDGMKLVDIIQREKSIHKFDLMDKASMGPSDFEKKFAYTKHRWRHQIEYDRRTGIVKPKEIPVMETNLLLEHNAS